MDNKKHSVLIIDDQRLNITTLSKALRSEYNVYAAGNGPDALIAVENSPPDVILLDIKMEGMDGFEVITKLKSNEKTKDIPVIFLTGKVDLESEEKGLSLGAADYIRKPFLAAIVKMRLEKQIKIINMEDDLKQTAGQLEEAREEVQEATKVKSTFFSHMSHEIRTPMNAITGMGELLQNENLEERQMGYVNDIVTSAKSLLEIINDILDYSKIESGTLTLYQVDYNFNAFINQLESMFSFIAKNKGLEFRFTRENNLPGALHGDEFRLRQILTNIIGNAIKFTDKGYVSVNVSVSNGMIIFAVEDSGIGIREEEQPKLFNALENAERSMNRNVIGTGLGLAISKSFVEMMGGSITLESEYGKGTTFYISIPIVDGSKEIAAKKANAEKSRALFAPDANVLVVDDNELNRKVAFGILGMMKIEAKTVDSGFKAINYIQRNDYDIVFMDHMMPEMDGIETTRKIREMGEKYSQLPIIALTANAVPGAREMFLANGFDDFVSKPIIVEELVRVLENWLPLEKIQTNIDYEEHQSLLNREEELYRKSIVTFVKENRNTFDKITGSLSASDIKTAHRIVHTLKSSAGYLGKKELQDAALSLEQSLQPDTAKQPSYTPEQLDVLLKELDKVLREFEPIIKEAEALKPESVQMDESELKALLSELKPLLEKSDFGAQEYVEKLHGITGMKELAEYIDNYDFDSALQLLASLM
jgi:signal transduction histidine kinase/HPt (histidine-containing phosphotransfer) domain-containing protein